MSQHRRRRGAETQRIAATWFQQHGFPHCLPVGAGAPGIDLLGMPGQAPEVKARRQLDLPGWLRQASRNADGRLPWVLSRPDGFGETTIADWPVTLRLADFTTLIRAAGYGDPIPEEGPTT